MKTKKCSKCFTTKGYDLFHKSKSSKDGIYSYCKICTAIDAKIRYKKHRGLLSTSKKYRGKFRRREKKARLKFSYKLNIDTFDKMYSNQEGHCAICNNKYSDSKLFVDHNHKTGKVRQLLCIRCNSGIGRAKENIKILENAIKYLEKHS